MPQRTGNAYRRRGGRRRECRLDLLCPRAVPRNNLRPTRRLFVVLSASISCVRWRGGVVPRLVRFFHRQLRPRSRDVRSVSLRESFGRILIGRILIGHRSVRQRVAVDRRLPRIRRGLRQIDGNALFDRVCVGMSTHGAEDKDVRSCFGSAAAISPPCEGDTFADFQNSFSEHWIQPADPQISM